MTQGNGNVPAQTAPQPIPQLSHDPGNRHLSPAHPAELVVNNRNTMPEIPPGILLVTVRHAGTTLSMLLSRDDVLGWSDLLRRLALESPAASGLIVPTVNLGG